MAEAVARQLKNAAREVEVGDCRFDVVAYDKKSKLFMLVECKRATDHRRVGQTFGQVGAYRGILERQGFEFVDAFSKKFQMRFGRWMEATQWAEQIRVEFYVALTDEACKDVERLRGLKQQHPDVGIIRVKPDGVCRDYIRVQGKKDDKLTRARAMTIRLWTPEAIEHRG
jgi:hypothetical protein